MAVRARIGEPQWGAIRMNVVFLIHNRPDLTRQVLGQIRAARPERLLVFADGPSDVYSGEIVAASAGAGSEGETMGALGR